MAQKWRKGAEGQKSVVKPLDGDSLMALALRYVGRYATSRAKLGVYLARKLRERGWAGEGTAPVDSITDRMAHLRYVDDMAYATMTSGAMQRRGLGTRRISQKLMIDGIEEDVRDEVRPNAGARWAAAERLARRKRIGPYAAEAPDRALREKQIATFLRAGHDMSLARKWVNMAPGQIPDGPEED
jgi:regulatory protein